MRETHRVGVYVRLSSDRSGERLGVERQREACEAKARAMEWQVARVYEDNDRSAFTRKRRPAYEQMLADLERGAIGGVVVWDLDRLTRRPIEVEAFIELADRVGAVLASCAGDFDLSTSQGRMFARMRGAIARQEIEHRSERQRLANEQRAHALDMPTNGRRPFGYTYEGQGRTKRLVVDPVEAEHVRRAVAHIIDGGTLRGVVRDFTSRGVVTTAGNEWRPTQLRRMLVNPRYAGIVTYQGARVGVNPDLAIIDEDTHHAVVSIIHAPERRRPGRPRQYLLSGVAHCATCGMRIYGLIDSRKGYTLYQCESRQHVVRQSVPVDDHVVAAILAVLTVRAEHPWLFAHDDAGADTRALAEQAHSLSARMDALAEAFADGSITAQQLKAGTARLRDSLDEIERERAEAVRSDVLPDLLPADDVRAVWDGLDIDQRRAIVADLCTPLLRGVGRGAKGFNPETVTFEWKVTAPVRVTCPHTADGDEGTLWVEEVNDDGASRGWAPLLMRVDRQHGTVHMLPDRPCSCAPDPDRLTWAREHGVLVIDAASGS